MSEEGPPPTEAPVPEEDETGAPDSSKPRWTRQPRGTLAAQIPRLETLDPVDQAEFGGYVRAKASMLVERGLETYRSQDAFGGKRRSLPQQLGGQDGSGGKRK